MPAISVVVCTRDRGLRVLATVRSVLAANAPDLECLVIDQSQDTVVADTIAQPPVDPRLRYIRTSSRGLSCARNEGLRLAHSPIVAMTDDDCVVDRAWASEILRAFTRDPRIALVFGNVMPAPFNPLKGFVPGYEREVPFLAVGPASKLGVEGMGACMAVNRAAAIALGGFDERLGAGSALGAGEDVDLTLRVLSSGYAVFETPDIQVTHHRFESWANRPSLVRAYWRGAGAALGKHLRHRPLPASLLLAQMAIRFVFGRSRVARSMGPHGIALARVTSFIRGLGTGAALRPGLANASLRATGSRNDESL